MRIDMRAGSLHSHQPKARMHTCTCARIATHMYTNTYAHTHTIFSATSLTHRMPKASLCSTSCSIVPCSA